MELPEALTLREVAASPLPCLKIGPPDPRSWWSRSQDRPCAELSFRYEDLTVAYADPRGALANVEAGLLLRRDRAAEAAAADKLREAGFQGAAIAHRDPPELGRYDIARGKLPAAVRLLVGNGETGQTGEARVDLVCSDGSVRKRTLKVRGRKL